MDGRRSVREISPDIVSSVAMISRSQCEGAMWRVWGTLLAGAT